MYVLLYTSVFAFLECELGVLLIYKCIYCLLILCVCYSYISLLSTYLLCEYVCLTYIQFIDLFSV